MDQRKGTECPERFHRNKTRDKHEDRNTQAYCKYTRRSGQRGTGDTNHQKKEVCEEAREVKTFKIKVELNPKQ